MAEVLRLTGRVSDLADGLTVRRILPSAARRAVGPFVFFDHFGPVTLPPETDSDVGGHPHIGLATVSYLFEGSMLHRDSLGTVQTITPGAINWMTAGRGIVHSERVTDAERGKSRRLRWKRVTRLFSMCRQPICPRWCKTKASTSACWSARPLVWAARFGPHRQPCT